ncbi:MULTISPECIES: hypothetical protein [unclassified Microcoleus]|uniref:hypothetical protein n=1 Tax=unclassified Microcoleus TaxID=2642155 RepID=UPI002FCF43FA
MSLQKELWLPGMKEEYLVIPDKIEDFLEIQISLNSTDAEFEKMVLVNNSAQNMLNGTLDLDSYLDILDYAEIDPFFHLQEAAWQVANLFNY